VVRIIERAGCGLAANPDDPASVADAIRNLIHSPEQLPEMARRAREASFAYDRAKQLEIFSAAVEDAVTDRSYGKIRSAKAC
jgi:glycosyltransferase involved in cell wall biosynthesis